VKSRTIPHKKLIPSYYQPYNGFNEIAFHEILGQFQKIDNAWCQRRISGSGLPFELRGHGNLTDEIVERWQMIEPELDEYVLIALNNMVEPWEAPDELLCDELVLKRGRSQSRSATPKSAGWALATSANACKGVM
jgi:hypothetical protein